MHKKSLNANGFGLVGVAVIFAALAVVAGTGVYVYHKDHKAKTPVSSSTTSKATSQTSKSSTSASTSTTTSTAHSAQEAVDLVQTTYASYLAAVNKANSDGSHTQPVAQVGLEAVKDNLSSSLYVSAAAVTQATPFSCTAQYVADAYTASLSSSDGANTVVAVSISNGSGLHTDGMKVTVDLTTLKIASVTCPN